MAATSASTAVAVRPRPYGGPVAQREDRATFEDFVAQHYGRLRRTAIMLVTDPGHAEDLVQEALLRAHRHWPTASAAPLPYVRAILANLARDRYRAAGRRPRETDLYERDAPALDPLGDVTDRQAVRAALAELPDRQRAVVVLRYFDDLSTAQTAAALGCSEGTVKSHLSRALRALERRLGPDPEGGDRR